MTACNPPKRADWTCTWHAVVSAPPDILNPPSGRGAPSFQGKARAHVTDRWNAARPDPQAVLEQAALAAAERAAADWVAGRYTPRWVKALAGAAMPADGPAAPPRLGSA